MKIIPSKSALQNLLALIDASNPSAPNLPNEVTVSNLQSGTYANSADTKITLTGTGPQGNYANFTGSIDVTYKRLTLAAEIASPTGAVVIPSGTTDPAATLALVADWYGFIRGEISWVSAPTYPAGGGAATATIQASGSLIYEDGTATVNLNWATPQTILLMHMDGANGSSTFTDTTGQHTFTRTGTVALSTAQSKFGGSSMLGVSSSYVQTPDVANLHLKSDFTIEFWLYLNSSNAEGVIIHKGTTIIEIYGGNIYSSLDTLGEYNMSPAPSLSNWHHYAFVKHGTAYTLYLDGVAVVTKTSPNTWGDNTSPLTIGNYAANTALPVQGYLDELRISALARYTANFTPPTAPFTVD